MSENIYQAIKSQENKFFLDEQVIWFIGGVQKKVHNFAAL